MKELASQSQLRMSFLRWALFCVSLILFLGVGSGIISNSGYDNAWFVTLAKPVIFPPGWVFATVWTVLYILLGLAITMVLCARGARGRGFAISIFIVQMILNFSWSPLFFGAHQVTLALYLIVAMLVLAVITAFSFWRIRTGAGLLMLPYVAWLCFAAFLNFTIDQANPDAETLVAPAISTQI